MRFPFLTIDASSFLVGFITATIFWWLIRRMRPLSAEMHASWRRSREEAQARRSSGMEDNHRRITLRRAQGMHLAAPLFALNEIIEPPCLLAPPAQVIPGKLPVSEDVVSATLPYMPAWPELGGFYNAPTLDLAEVIAAGTKLVITGQPGAGKTVALAYLATQIANRDIVVGELGERVPFLYHIADLQVDEGENKDVLDPIIEAASRYTTMPDLERLSNFIHYAFQSGRALLLLDGFDELPSGEQLTITAYLKAFFIEYPKTQAVTTGSPEHLSGLIDLGFEAMPLKPWNIRQQNAFIEKWGQLWKQTVTVEAWAQNGPEQLDPMLINAWLETDNQSLTPLELTLKIWGAYAGDSLGPSVLDALATHIRRLAPANTPLAALETLGMQVTLSAQAIFDPHTAREWVRKFEPVEAESVLESGVPEDNTENLAAEEDKNSTSRHFKRKKKTSSLGKNKKALYPIASGLLDKMADSGLLILHPNHRMRFLHPVVGGYLAGRALASYNADERLLKQPDWNGKFLAIHYIAVFGDASRMAEGLLNQSELPLYRPLFTAARWLRDAPHNAAWRVKVLSKLAALLRTDGIPLGLRGQAMAAFATSGDPSTGPLFQQFLESHSFELIQLAALGSGFIQDTKAVNKLSSILNAPSATAQQAGCLALVAIGISSAMESVARALLQGEEDLRRAAAEALANDPTEGHAMLKEGITLPDILLRRAVIYGLARIDEPWATKTLQHIRVDDEQWVVRNSATEVLESREKSNPRIPQPLTPPSETPWLIEFAGAQGTGIAPGSPVTDILIAALKSEKEEVRLAALQYLKRTPTKNVIANLYEAMYCDDPRLREAVFLVLCELASSGIKLPSPQQTGLI